MPIQNYGVWKAKPLEYTYETDAEDNKSPHLTLYFADGDTSKARAAINIKSGDSSDSRLIFWTVSDFRHPLTTRLKSLQPGFVPLAGTSKQGPGGLALDYLRSNAFDSHTGVVLPHDIPGENNDIIDVLRPILDRAINKKSTIYLYGSQFGDGEGIHNVHLNQGSPKRWAHDNGVYQDGGFIVEYDDHWVAVFIGFASQAAHTIDGGRGAGNPTPATGYVTWAKELTANSMSSGAGKSKL
ncbi:hypothetical protein B0J11DRAFT_542637 [Dendryphion nanum]|uniref:DUF2278 family protein n=1 Tax=Dendryphion nanum TaxID=256645 RepID=A0A9P9D413_9PLEO|nr:hypothetical protein B0J11DRAFT_542637 [Dendryphion nanum]